jgi:hypothetical protein
VKFTVDIDGDLDKLMRREVLAGERAVKAAMTTAALALKADWRAQVAGSGLGRRLANAVRSKVYPEAGSSLNAAAFVYAQPNKKPTASAADLLDVFNRGAVISSSSGFWLAIPLPAAGKAGRGARMTPAMWEQRTGRKLSFIYRKGKSGLLVDTGVKRAGNVMVRRRVRGGSKLGAPTTFTNRTIPIFALVRQVKLPKRLNLFPAAERIAALVPGNIVANWRE